MNYDYPDDPRLTEQFYTLTNLRQAQLVMLRLTKIFDAICKKHNLRYWLDAGTLLGAARHDGFIPWDDDIDVAMPIEDYKKFCAVAEQELPADVFFQTQKTDPHHDISWSKLRDRYSYMNDLGGPYPYNQGIPIDIFPMYLQTKRQFNWRTFISVLPPFNNPCESYNHRHSFKHNLFNIVIGILQHIFLGFMQFLPLQKYFITWTQNDEKNGYVYNPERPWFQFFPPEVIFDANGKLGKIRFEDAEFSAPIDVERFLTIYFGDWRTPPPESKRNGHKISNIHITDAGPKPDKNSLTWKNQ